MSKTTTTLQLEIDYGRKEAQIKAMSNVAVSQDYINFAVKQKYPQMDGQKLRMYGRLQRKLDRAVDENLPSVELEQAEVDLIKLAFRDVKFDASLAKYVVHMMDVIEDLGAEPKGSDSKSKDEKENK